jgi:hypothetical protein
VALAVYSLDKTKRKARRRIAQTFSSLSAATAAEVGCSLGCGKELRQTMCDPNGLTAMRITSIRLAVFLTLSLSAINVQGEQPTEKKPTDVRLFPFHEGGKEGKWGYINRSGEVVVAPRFRQALDFDEGLARVQTEKTLDYIDAQGKTVFTIPEKLRPLNWTRPFSDGLAAFAVKRKCGYFDRQGKVVVDPKYDDVKEFSEGLAAVNEGAKSERSMVPLLLGGKWGFIDKTGRLIVPLQFDRVDPKGFSDGKALVQSNGKWSFIDKAGKVVIEPKRGNWWPDAHGFSEGLALMRGTVPGGTKSRLGFIDKTGKFAIEPRFEEAEDFSEGLAVVVAAEKHGYVDRTGRIVIEPQFTKARNFSEGFAAVRSGEHWSYVDKQGKVVIAGRFNDAKDFKGGLARVHEGGSFAIATDGLSYWLGGEWFYINQKGEKARRYCKDDDDRVYDP